MQAETGRDYSRERGRHGATLENDFLMNISKSLIGLAATGLVSLGTAHATLVVNGGFETGDFTGWSLDNPDNTLTYADNGSSLLFQPHSGNYYALFTDTVTDPTLSQTISATPGASLYDIDFWVNDQYGNSDLVVDWGGTQLLHLDTSYSSANGGPAGDGWEEFNFLVDAPASDTDLSFAVGTTSNLGLGLDDISVTAVPEPGTWAAGAGLLVLLGCGAFSRWRRQATV